jgi:hypothetical protein
VIFVLLAPAGLATPPQLAGDPLTVATGSVFDGPTGLIATPTRLATELSPTSGVGARNVGYSPGPVGFASFRAGEATIALSGGYAGGGVQLLRSDPEAPPVLGNRYHLAELGLGLALQSAAGTAFGISAGTRANWQTATLPYAFSPFASSGTLYGAAFSSAPDDRGTSDALDIAVRAAAEVAGRSARGGWLAGVSTVWMRSAEWISVESGQFDESGVLTAGTTLTGFDPEPSLGLPNQTGAWPGLHFAVDRGADPVDFAWRLEAEVQGGRLTPAEPTSDLTEIVGTNRYDTRTDLTDPSGGGAAATVSLWRGFPASGEGRVRVGAVLRTWQEQRRWVVAVTQPEGATPVADVNVVHSVSQLSAEIPVAVDAPLSARARLAAGLTGGIAHAHTAESGTDGSHWESLYDLPWLEANAGLSGRATRRVWVHALLASAPVGIASVQGYPTGVASPPGGHGAFAATASLWITSTGGAPTGPPTTP